MENVNVSLSLFYIVELDVGMRQTDDEQTVV